MVDWKDLLDRAGISLADVDKAFDSKMEDLKKKKTIREKRPLGGYNETDAGRFVTLREKTYPIKMFVLQEMSKGQYVRIGYYVVSLKKLKEEKKLKIVWAQFNPSFLKKDLLLLLDKARKEKII
jgi:hypothetical protein